MDDLANDPVVRFQNKHYVKLLIFMFFALPMAILHLIFPEMTLIQVFVANYGRLMLSHHFTFSVNSLAHMWGDKPYDKYISPSENKLVSVLAVGEGWHNYHHTFPWDYKASEFGYKLNLSTLFIDFFAMIGWTYDLKTVSHKLLQDRINRTGDGSQHAIDKDNGINKVDASEVELVWGWGDEAVKEEDVVITETRFPLIRKVG